MKRVSYEEGHQLLDTHTCECGLELVFGSGPPFYPDGYIVKCPADATGSTPGHQGIKLRDNPLALVRSVPVERQVGNILHGMDINTALGVVMARFPRAHLDGPSAALFVLDCLRLDLDPLLGEIIPTTFNNKHKVGDQWLETVVVVPMITEDGYLSLAARACKEDWIGPPRTLPIEAYLRTLPENSQVPYAELKEMARDWKVNLCDDADAYLWVAIGGRRNSGPREAFGWYKMIEKKDPDKSSLPSQGLPGNQARVRAVKRWVREVFPEARAQMVQQTRAWMERAKEVPDAIRYVDAEYQVLDEEIPPGGPGAGQPPAGAPGAASSPPAAKKETAASYQMTEKQWGKVWGLAKDMDMKKPDLDTLAGKPIETLSVGDASTLIDKLLTKQKGGPG